MACKECGGPVPIRDERGPVHWCHECYKRLFLTSQARAVGGPFDGGYVPAIPLPFYIGWRLRTCKCTCGRKFKNGEMYRGHFALVHILGQK